jgi:lipopolysaccharide export system protein LptA
MKYRIYIIFTLVLWQFTFPQDTGADDEKLRLVHADVLMGKKDDRGRETREFVGNVKFRQGETILTCNRATEFINAGRYELFGNVAYVDTAKSLFGDKFNYYEATKIAYVDGNVRLLDSTKTMTADKLVYNDEKNIADATGNVFLSDEKEKVVIVGDDAHYRRDDGYAKITGHGALTKTDTTDADTLKIYGKVFQMFDDGDRFLVTDSVRVVRGEIEAFCDTLEYFEKESIIKLGNSPRVHQGRQYLTGNSVSLLMQESDVKGIHIVGNAIATSTVDSTVITPVPYDLLSGQDMMVYVTDEKIDSVRIKERATSYYHVLEEGVEKGLNKALGDELFIRFNADTLSSVRVKSDPGASLGQFHPPSHRDELESELRAELNKLGIVIDGPVNTTPAIMDSTEAALEPADELQ